MTETLGDYTLEALLGRGAMGAVFRARHRPTGAIRAIKVISGAVDAEGIARFRREAESLARAGGDGVVPIHEIGTDRGRLFIALGMMSGGSLRARVGKATWREAAELGAELARALERCHAAGLIHRDLKPDNVLMDEHGRPRLADFGLVRDLAAKDLTRSGLMIGTPAYMAPEQIEGKRADARTDVYALGCMIHELIVGVVPLLGDDLANMHALKLRGRTEAFPAALGVPRALDTIVDRAVAPRAADRYASAAALGRDLERLLAGKPPREVTRAQELRTVALLALGLVVAAAAIAGAIVSSQRSPMVVEPTPATIATPSPAAHVSASPAVAVAQATHALRLLIADLAAGVSMDRLGPRADQVLALAPLAALPADEVARLVDECRQVLAHEPPLLEATPVVDRFFRNAYGVLRLARRFGAELPLTDLFVDRGAAWAHNAFHEARDEDWCVEGLEALRFAMHTEKRYAGNVGHGASALLRRHRAPVPELQLFFEQAEAILEIVDVPSSVEVRVEFTASLGEWNEALRVLLKSAPLVKARPDRKRLAYALQRSGWSSQTPVEAALLDQVVALYRDSPEFFALSAARYGTPETEGRLSDMLAGARSDLLDTPVRATAYLRMASTYERQGRWEECLSSFDERPAVVSDFLRANPDDSKRHARVLLRLGRQSEAGRVLEEAGGDLTDFAREARAAKTTDARLALAEKLK